MAGHERRVAVFDNRTERLQDARRKERRAHRVHVRLCPMQKTSERQCGRVAAAVQVAQQHTGRIALLAGPCEVRACSIVDAACKRRLARIERKRQEG